MTNKTPTGDEIPVLGEGSEWGQGLLIQALINQLIELHVLPVDRAERIFDMALAVAVPRRQDAPGAEAVIKLLHGSMGWDNLYKWSAQQKQKRDGTPPAG